MATRFRAMWWWCDRWRRSTAFMDLTVEEQGAYRNLLDEAQLRGGAIPDDERVLAKACGDPRIWGRVRAAVMARFVLQADGWHNETLDSVMQESARRAAKQQRWREVHLGPAPGLTAGNAPGNAPGNAAGNNRGNAGGNAGGNDPGNNPGNNPGNKAGSPSPSPSLSLDPSPDQSPDRLSRHSPARGAGTRDARFDLFWAAYPTKKGKAAAFKAWRRLHPSEQLTELILDALLTQAAWPEWQREQGRFIPNPATWLNQGRWDDEPARRTSLLSDIGQQNQQNASIALDRILRTEES